MPNQESGKQRHFWYYLAVLEIPRDNWYTVGTFCLQMPWIYTQAKCAMQIFSNVILREHASRM